MKAKVLQSFVGSVCGTVGDVIDIPSTTLYNDLVRMNCIEPITEPTKKKTKTATKKTTKQAEPVGNED